MKAIASAKPGYRFNGWKNISVNDTIEILPHSINDLIAVFEPICTIPDTIKTTYALVQECSPYYLTQNIIIAKNGNLSINSGVELFLNNNSQIINYGKLSIKGTESSPVHLTSLNEEYWKGIVGQHSSLTDISYTKITNAQYAFRIYGSTLKAYNSWIYESECNCSDLCSFQDNSILEIYNSHFIGNTNSEKIDCIDAKSVYKATIDNCSFKNITDDAIDIGMNSQNVTITNNKIYNINSVGISLGEGTKGFISGNIVSNCEVAIQSHTGAYATVVNNTLAQNNTAVQLYHYENLPESAGSTTVLNTIFHNNAEDFDLFPESVYSASYSLSNTSLLKGISNLYNSPLFANAFDGSFKLKPGSPCINAGSSKYGFDKDNSYPEIGAVFFKNGNFPSEQMKVIQYPNPMSNYCIFKTNDGFTISKIQWISSQGHIIDEVSNLNHALYYYPYNLNTKGLLHVKVILSDGSNIIERVIVK